MEHLSFKIILKVPTCNEVFASFTTPIKLCSKAFSCTLITLATFRILYICFECEKFHTTYVIVIVRTALSYTHHHNTNDTIATKMRYIEFYGTDGQTFVIYSSVMDASPSLYKSTIITKRSGHIWHSVVRQEEQRATELFHF